MKTYKIKHKKVKKTIDNQIKIFIDFKKELIIKNLKTNTCKSN